MVVADYQNDVVPVEDSHHLKPDVGLVRVRWDRAQKGQVDALQGRTRAQHRLWGCHHTCRDGAGVTKPFGEDLWDAHLELISGTCILPSGREANPGYDFVPLRG